MDNSRRMTGKHALLQTLQAEEVRHIFGNPGTSESAIMSTLDGETTYVTTQLSIYLTGAIDARTGTVTAEGRIIHRGGRVATAEGRLTDEKGRLLAHGTATCLLLPRNQGGSR